ncbi:HEAT repeat domain-containing protein [uncultured Microscilla sp.]|uniref:HEAT repeat domain-containing protein n=1 Tax=uncultured Microscilla sp. TaxID=432653 RepID=UPI00260FD1DB|nr:HEAT repeat domain-containing protein [uncultured Microscilla sp.]
MHTITRLLVQAGLIEMNEKKLKRWAKKRKISCLIYALKHAHYTHRTYAATLLAKFEQPKVIQALVDAVDDTMSYVSLEAIAALEKMKVSSTQQAYIAEKKRHWEAALPQIIATRSNIQGGIAGFYSSNIPSPDSFINNDNSGCYGV